MTVNVPVSTKNEGSEVKGKMNEAAVTITRPANTTPYAAKDTIADSASDPTILTFSDVARQKGRGGYIVGARIMTDQVANTVQYKLHLFNASPTLINDNVAMTAPLYADADKYIGAITFPAVVQEQGAGAAFAQQLTTIEPPMAIPYICDEDDTDIYGILECLNGFTPASGQKFDIRLTVEIN